MSGAKIEAASVATIRFLAGANEGEATVNALMAFRVVALRRHAVSDVAVPRAVIAD